MLRAIIIDDESIGITTLKLLIDKYISNIKVIATAGEPEEGIRQIEDYKPDIVFLDINMPRMNGFEMLEHLNFKSFKLIFTTAHQEHALKAIKNKAYDFLLKPIDVDDLKKSMEGLARQEQAVRPLLSPAVGVFEINMKNSIIFIKLEELLRLEASGSYTVFYLKNSVKHTASRNIKEYEMKIDASVFFRCHSSNIINLREVVEMVQSMNRLYAKMSDGSLVEISRKNRQLFLTKMRNMQVL